MADGQRSISPNTMSSEPVIAETSASMCPRLKKIHRLQMGERRRPDLALVRPVAAVRHQVDAKLALGRLDRCVDLAGGLFHLRARRTRSVRRLIRNLSRSPRPAPVDCFLERPAEHENDE